jgi:hypothetical protein
MECLKNASKEDPIMIEAVRSVTQSRRCDRFQQLHSSSPLAAISDVDIVKLTHQPGYG